MIKNYLGDGFGGFVEASTAYVRRVARAIAVEEIQFTFKTTTAKRKEQDVSSSVEELK